MPLPVQDAWISQGFGPTEEKLDGPYAGYDHFNKGIDFAASAGTPVSATAGGKVISAGDSGDGWGLSVKIRDASGYTHNYGHLSSINVKAGDTIGEGASVGKVGSTGKSTGPHLSYDVWDEDGTFVDPQKWVGMEGESGERTLSTGSRSTSDVNVVNKTSGDDSRDSEEAWYNWKAKAGYPVKETDGEVYRLTEVQDPETLRLLANLTAEEKADWIAEHGGVPMIEKWVPDEEGQYFYDQKGLAATRAKWAAEDAKVAKEKEPAVRSYLDTEKDKTSEIKRQYEDFQDRGSLFYDLRDQEDAAIQKGNLFNQQMAEQQSQHGGFGFSDVYVGQPSGSRLSDMLRPSLPDYVRPDYRLNGAVGLPGEEGFDDQDFNGFGMPYYSEGTRPPPVRRIPMEDGIPPEIRAMLGKPSIPMPRSPNTPPGIPYNGQSQRVRALVAAGRAR